MVENRTHHKGLSVKKQRIFENVMSMVTIEKAGVRWHLKLLFIFLPLGLSSVKSALLHQGLLRSRKPLGFSCIVWTRLRLTRRVSKECPKRPSFQQWVKTVLQHGGWKTGSTEINDFHKLLSPSNCVVPQTSRAIVKCPLRWALLATYQIM